MQTPAVRRPAVAGRFYPGKPEDLTQQLDQYLAAGSSAPGKMETAMGCMVPHAGYIYSGQVAGSVFQRLPARATYIILCPNHTGRGAPLAIMSRGEWQTPLGTVPIDAALAASLQHSCRLLMEDSKAHESEHAIEVELPFLQRSVGEFSFVPIAIGVSRYAALEALGHGMAQSLKGSAGPVMIVASSDMNHYEPDDVTRVKDRKAIDQILALDPAGCMKFPGRRHHNVRLRTRRGHDDSGKRTGSDSSGIGALRDLRRHQRGPQLRGGLRGHGDFLNGKFDLVVPPGAPPPEGAGGALCPPPARGRAPAGFPPAPTATMSFPAWTAPPLGRFPWISWLELKALAPVKHTHLGSDGPLPAFHGACSWRAPSHWHGLDRSRIRRRRGHGVCSRG